eukprot:COSAG01_NODE_598_length_15018_cov_60.164488_12_plen_179_part_00
MSTPAAVAVPVTQSATGQSTNWPATPSDGSEDEGLPDPGFAELPGTVVGPAVAPTGRRRPRHNWRSEGRNKQHLFSALMEPPPEDGILAELGLSAEYAPLVLRGSFQQQHGFFVTGTPQWPDCDCAMDWRRVAAALQQHPEAASFPCVREAALLVASNRERGRRANDASWLRKEIAKK